MALGQSTFGTVTVSVDMDTATAGVQDTRIVAPGDAFSVDLLIDIDAGGLSAYSVSADIDSVELTVGTATELTPAPYSNVTGGVASTVATRVSEFEGFTFAIPAPSSTTIKIGTIDFTVPLGGAIDDGLADVEPALISVNDLLLDDAGLDVLDPAFEPGYVVPIPEPGTLALLALGSGIPWLRRARRGA
jgi:hypothetical protein